MTPPAQRSQAGFPTTCWTLMLSLRASDNDTRRNENWGRICENYWFPLYAFARHRGISRPDAEDAVQGFFATVGTPEYFEKAEQERGKLRTFLLTGFTRYLKDLAVQRNAQKRGGGQTVLSLDIDQAEEWLQAEEAREETEVLGFERHWAQAVMRSAMQHLAEDAARDAKSSQRFAILKRFLAPESCLDYSREDACHELGLSPDGCDKAIQRLRQSFRQTVKDLIAGTLENPSPDSIHEEMQQLQRSLVPQ